MMHLTLPEWRQTKYDVFAYGAEAANIRQSSAGCWMIKEHL